MSTAAELSSGKGSTDENFPVASHLIAPRHRPLILGFYAVARLADDVADHPSARPEEKLARLDEIEASLLGADDRVPESVALRAALQNRGLEPTHTLDLLTAFRRDVTQLRYRDWADLMDYCRYSAAPVGRFVLDVHGEARTTWPASDALCAALQVINHLQDCQKDYLALDRVYLPLDHLQSAGASVEMLAAERSTPALAAALAKLAEKTSALLDEARPFARQIRDLRLALEVGAIQRLAESLTQRLRRRDPLADKVHHGRIEALVEALLGAGGALGARLTSRQARQAGP
ncbi:MAG: squalene synthase HpnC [Caulobacteraceae bacterium]|nr:squalene synthase HpnC [Caulobacteraceae bacterium]